MNQIAIVRTWPQEHWVGIDDHAYVVDNATRVITKSELLPNGGFYTDYRALSEVGTDFITMDWDIAIGRDELRAFADKCRENPGKLRAGPYRSYPGRRTQVGVDPTQETTWHAWHSIRPDVEVQPGDPTCRYFGIGFLYVPFSVWTAFADDFTKKFPDPRWCSARNLASWYHANVAPTIDLDWNVNLVHLNYSISDALNLDY